MIASAPIVTEPHSARAPRWLIVSGSCVFILALAVSAIFVPDIRWLHVFQASIYVVTSVLSLRGSRWGYFTGISAAGLWNYLGLFASPLFVEIAEHPGRPDLLLQGFAWIANLLVIVGCAWGYSRLAARPRSDLGRLALTFVIATAYLAAAIAIFSPRYLDIFARMAHPHWPWVRG